MSDAHEHLVNTVKHGVDVGAGGTYLVSIVNIAVEIVNPLLTTVGLALAVIWWVYRIRELKNKEDKSDKS